MSKPRKINRHIDANAFFDASVRELSETQLWGGIKRDQYPHGTITLPKYTWIKASKTINLPPRICVQGDPSELHQVDMPCLYIDRENWDFNESQWLLNCMRAYNNKVNSNGNFGTHFKNFSMNCGLKCDGIVFRGAQCSSVENVEIFYAKRTGLYLARATSRTSLKDIEIQNRSPNKGGPIREGTCLHMWDCKGVTGMNLGLYMAEDAVEMYGCSNITLIGLNLEKVNFPFKLRKGTKSVKILGADIQNPQEDIIDLTGNRGNIVIEGTIRKAPLKTYYLDFFGNRQPLVNNATNSGGKDFRLRVESAKDVSVTVFN